MLGDAAIVVESFAVALLFRFAGNVDPAFWSMFWPFAIFAALAFVLLLNESGVYQSILRYTGIYQGVRVASATAIAAGGLFIADFAAGELLGLRPVPLSVMSWLSSLSLKTTRTRWTGATPSRLSTMRRGLWSSAASRSTTPAAPAPSQRCRCASSRT